MGSNPLAITIFYNSQSKKKASDESISDYKQDFSVTYAPIYGNHFYSNAHNTHVITFYINECGRLCNLGRHSCLISKKIW